MALNYLIEVAVPSETSNTERGRVFERFARRFLETQNYQIQEEVRLTASEVDLLGTENTTSERIFVECKAHRSSISAEVLQKLLGNVIFKNYASGWLISTFALGKDAKGFEDEWSQKPPEERRKLRIYPPDQLIDRLVRAKIIVDAELLQFDRKRFQVGAEAYLLLTQNGEYWALPVVDPITGIRSAALLFRADNGAAVTNARTLEQLAKTDSTLTLPWITDSADAQKVAATKLRLELESIVRVPVADHWADYRPARPEDFVGREAVQSGVFQFFDAVRAGTTKTRMIALKGPSGWGKSSSVLKIASRAANIRNKGKYFVFTVDSRAATTSRFPELAVLSAVRSAIDSGFISQNLSLEFSGTSSLFSVPGMQGLAATLQSEEKVLCVFFDQFEELLYKDDLLQVFDEMRRICAAVEEAQANLIIGFSWKTDGVIPSEHNAYHMWHALSDRRYEFELTPFSEHEVAVAIGRFAKELGQPIIPQLRRLLQDHCQGFPWLLKKLCIHILELCKNGIEQSEIINRSVNIQTLFKKDLEKLSSAETACIKQIAGESPAEFFKIAQNFGDDVVARLVDKRLVIRSGTRLTIYWDIFRDYILTEKIPYIPVTYFPQANFSRYVNALSYMTGKKELTYADLAKHMKLRMGATDNLVRDLVNVGHVDANRKEGRIMPTFTNETEAMEIAYSFWRSHDIVRRLYASKSSEGEFLDTEFTEIYRVTNKRSELGEKTIHAYSTRTIGWLRGLGIVAQLGKTIMLQDVLRSTVKSFSDVPASNRATVGTDFFIGQAPPSKVVAAFRSLCEGSVTREWLEHDHGRNTCYVLIKLGLMLSDGSVTMRPSIPDAEKVVAERAWNTPTVRVVRDILPLETSLSGLDVGNHIAERFGLQWSDGSKRRCGNALRQWAEWSSSVISRGN